MNKAKDKLYNPRFVDMEVKIGKYVVVNFQCSIAHDCTIGDFVTLQPNVHISGANKIEEEIDALIVGQVNQEVDRIIIIKGILI